MATKVSELRAEISRLSDLEIAASVMMSRDPDFKFSTGRISGSSSRYTLCVWLRRNGHHFWSVRHSCDGHADMVRFGCRFDEQCASETKYAPIDAESERLRSLWFDADRAVRSSLSLQVA